MAEFEREDRYIVIKVRDQEDGNSAHEIEDFLRSQGIAICANDCVVVEKDWPIYEQTWDAVQRLAEGRPQRVEELEIERNALKGFAEYMIDIAFSGGGLDGGGIQDAAEEYGLLRPEAYDPDRHEPEDPSIFEPGDTIYVYSDLMKGDASGWLDCLIAEKQADALRKLASELSEQMLVEDDDPKDAEWAIGHMRSLADRLRQQAQGGEA